MCHVDFYSCAKVNKCRHFVIFMEISMEFLDELCIRNYFKTL